MFKGIDMEYMFYKRKNRSTRWPDLCKGSFDKNCRTGL